MKKHGVEYPACQWITAATSSHVIFTLSVLMAKDTCIDDSLNIIDVFGDDSSFTLKQFTHLCLRKPNCLIFQSYFQLYRFIRLAKSYFSVLFQIFTILNFLQHLHLLNGYLIKFLQPF